MQQNRFSSNTSYAYDPQQWVIEADDGSLISFGYDVSGIRQARTDANGTTSYIVDANRD